MDEWAWHDVLYALWCLGDVERVEAIEEKAARVEGGYFMHYGVNNPRALNAEREAVLREMKRRASTDGPEMPVAVMLTFPGFANHRKVS